MIFPSPLIDVEDHLPIAFVGNVGFKISLNLSLLIFRLILGDERVESCVFNAS